MKREAERKRGKGLRVQVGYMKLWVESKLWLWEVKDELRMSQGMEVRDMERRRRKEGGERLTKNVFD